MKKKQTVDMSMVHMPNKLFMMELNSQMINKNRSRLGNVSPSEVLATSKYSVVNFRSYLDEKSLFKIASQKPRHQKD